MEGCGAQGGHGGPPHYKKTGHPIQWTMPPKVVGRAAVPAIVARASAPALT